MKMFLEIELLKGKGVEVARLIVPERRKYPDIWKHNELSCGQQQPKAK